MLWVIIWHDYKSLIYKLRSKWNLMMLQYVLIAGLIQFAILLVRILDLSIEKVQKTITVLSPCFMVCVILGGGCSSLNNCSLHIDSPIWAKDFEIWFVSPKDIIPLLCSPIFMCLGPLLILFCFLNCDFLTAIQPYRLASQSLFLIVDVDLFFYVQLFSAVWSSQPSDDIKMSSA